MNSKPQKNNNGWQACPDGAISSVSAELTAKESAIARRQFLKTATGAAVVLAGVSYAGWSLFGSNSGNDLNSVRGNSNYVAGVACSEVLKNLPMYVAKTIDDAEFVEAIRVHLTQCNHCKTKHDCLSSQTT